MNDWLHNVWSGLSTVSLDQANFILGVFGVWLMIRRKIWAFPVGLVAVSVQGVLFWRVGLLAEAKLQIFYFGGLLYGWWHWTRHKGSAPELPVTVLNWRGRLAYLAAGVAGSLVWAAYLKGNPAAVAPYRDAFLASFGIVAQLMQARKNIDNWAVWVAVNAAAVVVYLQMGKDLAYTAFLYLIYLGLAVAGWREWRRALPAASKAGSAEAKA